MRRMVIIAPTIAAGRAHVERVHPLAQLVAVVTPRTPHAARGKVADYAVIHPDMLDHPRIDELCAMVWPCMATTGGAIYA